MICQLVLSNIKKAYKRDVSQSHQVLSGISYTFMRNKTYCITGTSGAGKSTLLHILAGLDTPTTGSVFYHDGQKQYALGHNNQHFLQRLGFVFQSPYLINELTVLENVMLKGLVEQRPYDECTVGAQALLESVGLADKHASFPPMLSGGEQQRVALARALFNKPDFICADEPTSNLDEKTGKRIIDLLHTCQQQWGFGLIVCSHDGYVADTMEVVLKLEQGKLYDYKKNIVLQNAPSQQLNPAQ